MKEWVSVKVGMPNDEISCIVLQRCMDLTAVYPKFVQWDGKEWVDIDGAVVPGVIAWQKTPEYDGYLEELLSRVFGCYENDKCEEKDCCYFARCSDIAALLEYMNNKED